MPGPAGYWAALPTAEVGEAIIARVRDYVAASRQSGMVALWRQLYAAYYGRREGTPAWGMQAAGSKGELTQLRVNHLRALIIAQRSIVTAQKPSLEARAGTDQAEDMLATLRAQQYLEHVQRDAQLHQRIIEAVETALVLQSVYVTTEWDDDAGDVSEATDDTITRTGAVRYAVHRPSDVATDPTLDSCPWYVVRRQVSRWDLIARYPEHEDAIRSASRGRDDTSISLRRQWTMRPPIDDDIVDLFELIHEPTPSLPRGRRTCTLGSGRVLYDVELVGIRIRLMRPFPQWETPYGYGSAVDGLALQHVIDSAYSSIVSNVRANGVNNVIVEAGSGIQANSLSGGLKVLEIRPGATPPRVLEMLSMPEQLVRLPEAARREMELLTGINSSARGEPPPGATSGIAIALVNAQSVQAQTPLIASTQTLIESLGQDTIDVSTEMMDESGVLIMESANSRSITVSPGHLARIRRVVIGTRNPLLDTTSGKVEVANQLLSAGLLAPGQEAVAQAYLTVLETGRLEPLTRAGTQAEIGMRDENERLARGEDVQALVTDDHPAHIRQHAAVLALPASRASEQIVAAVHLHMQQHLALWEQASRDPGQAPILGAIGVQPLPSPDMPPEAMAVGGEDETAGQGLSAPDMPSGPAEETPKNPLTGEAIPVPDATGAIAEVPNG